MNTKALKSIDLIRMTALSLQGLTLQSWHPSLIHQIKSQCHKQVLLVGILVGVEVGVQAA